MSQQELDDMRKRLEAQGAVILPVDAVLDEIVQKLFFKTTFAIPGAGVYYTDEPDVFRLELDPRYARMGEEEFKAGLNQVDARLGYIGHEQRSDRFIVFVRLNR